MSQRRGLDGELKSPIDTVLESIEAKCEAVSGNLSQYGFHNAKIRSGGIEHKAFWEWNFFIGEEILGTIEIYLSEDHGNRVEGRITSGIEVWYFGDYIEDLDDVATFLFGYLADVLQAISEQQNGN